MSVTMNRHCIPGLTMSTKSPDGELLCGECPGIIKTMHTGFSVHVLHYAGALTRKKPDVMLAWKDLCSVLNALSK